MHGFYKLICVVTKRFPCLMKIKFQMRFNEIEQKLSIRVSWLWSNTLPLTPLSKSCISLKALVNIFKSSGKNLLFSSWWICFKIFLISFPFQLIVQIKTVIFKSSAHQCTSRNRGTRSLNCVTFSLSLLKRCLFTMSSHSKCPVTLWWSGLPKKIHSWELKKLGTAYQTGDTR